LTVAEFHPLPFETIRSEIHSCTIGQAGSSVFMSSLSGRIYRTYYSPIRSKSMRS
jgi:hypothetical protein